MNAPPRLQLCQPSPRPWGGGYLCIRAMHSRQGLDGAEVVLQLGHELLLASQGGHGLGQLDLQLGTAHCKTEPGLSPGGAPNPKLCQGDTKELRNPHLEQQSQLRAATLFSPYVWGQQDTSNPCSAPGSSPPW